MTDKRLPVTLLTGFLGAGKSTLLNKIVTQPKFGRIAVIVNEFGEVGLDHDLIEVPGDEVVLLSSGCICCSIRGDLAETMAGLIERREKGELEFDRVVIETTGLADPVPIQQTLLVDHFLAQNVFLDGVITVADVVNGPATLDAQFEAVSQAATADLILLSKMDLAAVDQINAFKDRLRGLNATAPIFDVAQATRKPGLMWGRSALRKGVTPQAAMAWVSTPKLAPAPAGPFANLSGLAKATKEPEFSPHDSRISSESIVLTEPLKDAVFDRWLDTLIALKGANILRVKGVVFLEGIEKPFVFHGVQHIFDPPVALQNWPAGDTTSRIVVIARDMTSPELQRSLDMLRAKQTPKPTPPVFPGWQEVEAKNWP